MSDSLSTSYMYVTSLSVIYPCWSWQERIFGSCFPLVSSSGGRVLKCGIRRFVGKQGSLSALVIVGFSCRRSRKHGRLPFRRATSVRSSRDNPLRAKLSSNTSPRAQCPSTSARTKDAAIALPSRSSSDGAEYGEMDLPLGLARPGRHRRLLGCGRR